MFGCCFQSSKALILHTPTSPFLLSFMTPALQYLEASQRLLERVRDQLPLIQQTADLFAKTILAGQMVHVFGSGHSRILVEEMWPRYGSFPGFN
ncbi:MAG: SIS domain-containing protein, partial [Verrucomicrobiaceae bacterium]|nr:SIS domain-containing protein [Verrucomicrobiaceae bacterium]